MDGTNLESAISEISYFLYVSTKSVPADTLMLLETIQLVKTCSKLTINAQERHQHLRWSLFINKVATHGKMKVLVALPLALLWTLNKINTYFYFGDAIEQMFAHYPAGIYLFKVSNENTRTMFEIYLNSTVKTSDDVNDFFLVSLLLTLNS